ncbi:Uncharacterised protein [Listeria grayi]|uniref:Uncharacterized protein n=1 Tax=Listeria grayi FSL F6-1183 TaxID=1265827 RepID=A0A829R3C7_LISGR|nr:hypothetical protein [Listeria grayi]EUJ26639.1 hypothetical protein LMUR_12566 [Listeria grayi FSL F6-1183]VEI35955.1 Uncharacterised protein [Listeria grayi]
METAKIFYVKRKAIKNLDGKIFEALRIKLRELCQTGEAFDATYITDQRVLQKYQNTNRYVKFYC